MNERRLRRSLFSLVTFLSNLDLHLVQAELLHAPPPPGLAAGALFFFFFSFFEQGSILKQQKHEAGCVYQWLCRRRRRRFNVVGAVSTSAVAAT